MSGNTTKNQISVNYPYFFLLGSKCLWSTSVENFTRFLPSRLCLPLQPPRLSAKHPIEEKGGDSHQDPPLGDFELFDHMGIADKSGEAQTRQGYLEARTTGSCARPLA